ncbi:MAG: Gfo/Idh/MocA family oxidoreductase [Clostridia bacterium]|nr:Gfo/Idh/MocA family oxidoreductase [Clostridia bacterium]
MEKIKIGIIGIGNMGTSHAKNILIKKLCPQIELVAVADVNPDRLAWAEENLPGVQRFDTAEAMLDSGLLDACIVAVPHYDHTHYAMECFKRHIHVMVEKPAGVYTKQVREMNEAAQKSDVVFGMMFNQRTNPMYIKMREIMMSGELGQLRRCNWLITNWFRSQFYYDSGDWRATWSGEGGGVLLNQCPHNLDLWQWICGMPVSVDVKMHFGKWHDIEVEDDVVAYVEYANGAVGTFITTTADCPGSNRFEVVCEKGTMIADAVSKTLTVIRLDASLGEFTGYGHEKGAFGSPAKTQEVFTFDNSGPAHPAVLNAFADAILNGGSLIAAGEEGINGLTLSNAMHLSAFLGKPVELPLDEDLYYEELMKRVKTSRKKDGISAAVSDTSGTY